MRFTIHAAYCFIILLAITACGSSDPNESQLGPSEITAADYYPSVRNTVISEILKNGDQIVAYTNSEFQIGYSKDGGQTYTLLVPESDIANLIPDGTYAIPRSIIETASTIFLDMDYEIQNDTTTKYGVLVIDRATLDIRFLAENSERCTARDGLEQTDGSWILVGSCDDMAAIYTADENFENINVLEKITSDVYGGQLQSIISASDGCLYAGGHYWFDVDNPATHIVIFRSCNQGPWVIDFDYSNAGHAYTSMRRLFEFNNKIQFFGHIGEDPDVGTQSAVTVVTGARNAANDWQFVRFPGTTVYGSSPAYLITYEANSCNMASITLLRETHISLSTDCGQSWGAPVLTDYGRPTFATLSGGALTLHHYGAGFSVDQVNLGDL